MLFFIHCHRAHFLALLTYPNHMEDNIRRFIYTQTQHIIVIIWHRTIREATVMTFYPGGFRSPPPGQTGFPEPGVNRVKLAVIISNINQERSYLEFAHLPSSFSFFL